LNLLLWLEDGLDAIGQKQSQTDFVSAHKKLSQQQAEIIYQTATNMITIHKTQKRAIAYVQQEKCKYRKKS
jgi:hypothetical protein